MEYYNYNQLRYIIVPTMLKQLNIILLIYISIHGCDAELQTLEPLLDGDKIEKGLQEIDSSEIMNKILTNQLVNYNKVNITGDLIYNRIEVPIKQKIRITNSKINGIINFNSTIFEEPVYFSNITFQNDIHFKGSRFKRGAYFINGIFLGDVYFNYAKFIENAFFVKNQFHAARFDFSKFDEDAYFQLAEFKKTASFPEARFNGNSFFNKAYFMDKAVFKATIFNQATQFSGSRFNKYAYFGNVQFGGNSYFERTTFERQADFSRTQFNKNAFFEYVKFLGDAYFPYAKFNGDALFDNAILDKRFNISNAKFDRFYIEWNYIKNKLDYDGGAYIALSKNYNDQEMFDSADECYYDYRKKSQNLKPFNWSKLLDIVAWLSCGYGKKPSYTLVWIFALIIGFGLIFWRAKFADSESISQKSNKKLKIEPFYFSLMNFIGASTGITIIGSYKYLASIERILGWLLLALFLVTLGAVMIR